MFENEKTYRNNSTIKYNFEKGDHNCNKLIVVFSGYADKNSKIKHKYNYVKSLQNINCHKLFILDDKGKTGSYYLGEKLNFDVESSIISLILNTVTHLNLSVQNIISLGSSKGGTAALYYGLKYKFGTIISGGFQTRISDLISTRRPESEDFLLGSSDSNEYIEKYNQLNNIVFDQLNSPIKSDIYLMTSKHDWQYEPHILPFIESLNDSGVNYHLEESDEMKNHSQISTYFPKFFNMTLLKVLYGINIKNYRVIHKNNIEVEIDYFSSNQNFNLKIVSIIDDKEYLHDTEHNLSPPKPGHYSTYIVVTDRGEIEHFRYSISHKFNGAGFYDILNSYAVINQGELYFKIQTTQNDKLTFAFYIYANEELLEFIPYQDNNSFKRSITSNKNYNVKCYIKSEDGSKVVITKKPTVD